MKNLLRTVDQINTGLNYEPRRQAWVSLNHFVFVSCVFVPLLFHLVLILIVVSFSPSIPLSLRPSIHPPTPPPPPPFLSKGTFSQKSTTESREKSDVGLPCKFIFYVLAPSPLFLFPTRFLCCLLVSLLYDLAAWGVWSVGHHLVLIFLFDFRLSVSVPSEYIFAKLDNIEKYIKSKLSSISKLSNFLTPNTPNVSEMN